MRGSQPCTAAALEASCIIPTSLFLALLLFSVSLSCNARTRTHMRYSPEVQIQKVLWGPNGVKQTVNQLQRPSLQRWKRETGRSSSARTETPLPPPTPLTPLLKTHMRRDLPSLKSPRIYKHKYWPHNDDVRT